MMGDLVFLLNVFLFSLSGCINCQSGVGEFVI